MHFFQIGAEIGTRQIEIKIDPSGRLLEVETVGVEVDRDSGTAIDPADLPAPVIAVTSLYQIHSARAIGEPATMYLVEGALDGSLVSALISVDGELLSYELDRDADGLGDIGETEHGTDPGKWDTDNDDYPDGFELRHGSDPLDASSFPQILSIQSDGAGNVIRLSVQTFRGADFTIQQCGDTAGTWTALGASFAGDDRIQVFILPIAEEIRRCFFRIAITPKPEDASKPGDTSKPEAGDCMAPDSITGFEINIADDDDDEGESRSLSFITATRGEIVRHENDEIEISPFAYTYEEIGDCQARVTLTFSTSDGFETEVFTLTFTSESEGAYISQEFEHGEPEDPEEGGFTLTMN
jgi:hypothetical protein